MKVIICTVLSLRRTWTKNKTPEAPQLLLYSSSNRTQAKVKNSTQGSGVVSERKNCDYYFALSTTESIKGIHR
jgi:hypothetical protein